MQSEDGDGGSLERVKTRIRYWVNLPHIVEDAVGRF